MQWACRESSARFNTEPYGGFVQSICKFDLSSAEFEQQQPTSATRRGRAE